MLRSIGSFGLRWVKRPWIVVAVCVLVCSALAAKAVGHVIEAQVLSDSPTAPRVPRVQVPDAPAATPRVDRGAQGSSLVTRDMFCSTCAPPPPPGPGAGPAAGDGIPLTSLPLVLVATSLGHQPVATVRDDRTGSQGAFEVGDSLPGSGEITKIGATYVDFVNAASEREERISLLALAQVSQPPPPPGAPTTTDSPYADRVKKIDDTRYEVERSLVKELVAAAGKPVPGVRMIPISKDGKLAGVRVLSARPDSIAGVLGLKGSDTLTAVNGVQIDSLDKMLELYSKMDDLNVVTIDGTRGGKPISWQYTMR